MMTLFSNPSRKPLALAASALFAALLAACSATSGSGAQAPGQQGAGEGQASIEVYKSDGSRQCEGAGESAQAMQARELADIAVLAARKDALRGVAFPTVCGGMTGDVNVFTIPAADWEKVRARGLGRWSDED